MRTLNFIFFLLLTSFAIGQQAKIHVNVHDVCGDDFVEDVHISLFWINGLDTTYIQETDQHTFTFDGLISTYNYLIKISSDENKPRLPKVKDLAIMRRSILGIDSMPDFGNFASDYNTSSGVSTLDIVLGSRIILGITPLPESPWYFLQNNFDSNNQPWNLDNQFVITDFVNNESLLDITAVKKGSSSQAMATYCNENCPDDPTRQGKIIYANAQVTKNTPITFPLYVPSNLNYLGTAFNIKASNSTITEISESAISHIIDAGKSANILWLSDGFIMNTQPTEITKITIIPNESGLLSNFFKLDFTNAITETAVLDNGCIISLNKLVLEDNYAAINECPISWPQNITIPGCIEDHITGKPSVDELCKNYFNFIFDDIILVECSKVIRTWTALNWGTGLVSTSSQIITTKADFDHICNTEFKINLGSGNRYVTARQLVVDPQPERIYSFSSINAADSIIFLKYEAPLTFQINVYNHSDESYCIAQVKKSLCDDNYFSIKELVSVNYQNGYRISATDFLSTITDPCAFITDFQISFDNGTYRNTLNFDQSLEGQTITLTLRYKLDNQFVVFGDVYAKLNIKEIIPENEPLKLFGYKDFVTAGSEFEIEIFSEGFDSLLAIQFGLKFREADVTRIEGKKLIIEPSNYYYNETNGELKFLWLTSPLLPVSSDPLEPLFSIFLNADRDGNLTDFISTDDINFSSEAVSAKLLVSKVSVDFILEERPSSTSESKPLDLKVSPNPIRPGSKLTIKLDDNRHDLQKIQLLNLTGQLVCTYELSKGSEEIDIPANISSGIYMLLYKKNNQMMTKKLIILD
jgi:Secretion system C-terminal sorting domain